MYRRTWWRRKLVLWLCVILLGPLVPLVACAQGSETSELEWVYVLGDAASEDAAQYGAIEFRTPFIEGVVGFAVDVMGAQRGEISPSDLTAGFGFAPQEDGESYEYEDLVEIEVLVSGYSDHKVTEFSAEALALPSGRALVVVAEPIFLTPCGCAGWQLPGGLQGWAGQVKVSKAYLGTPEQPGGVVEGSMFCGETATIRRPGEVTVNSVLSCGSSGCDKSYCYAILDPEGNLYESGSGHSVSLAYDPAEVGTYTVVLAGMCEEACCPPCVLFIKRGCRCGAWDPVEIIYHGYDTHDEYWIDGTKTVTCGDTVSVSEGYAFPLQTRFIILSGISCLPSNNDCPVTYGWEAVDPTGAVVSQGSGNSFCGVVLNADYQWDEVGYYTVILTAECDGLSCSSCQFDLWVDIIVGTDND
jgi:hypothetical protein